MSEAPPDSDSGPVEVVLFVRRSPANFLPTVLSLRDALGEVPLLIGSPVIDAEFDLLVEAAPGPVETMVAYSAGELVNHVADQRRTSVLAIDDAVLLPPDFLALAAPEVAGDPRIVSVSFLCNAAGPLSFPVRDTPVDHQIGSFDERSLTDRLRTTGPAQDLVPIAYAAGAVVYFSESGLTALGPLQGDRADRLEAQAAELSMRGIGRGMLSMLDPSTFYSRPYDLALLDQDTFLAPAERAWIGRQHRHATGLLATDREVRTSPLTIAMGVARAKTLGLRLLVDARALGPKEMGTQVQILALIDELAARDDVASIAVGLPGPTPAYAQKVLSNPKIDARACPADDFTAFGRVDVAHRPFQPTRDLDPLKWRRTAERSVITMQDLIAYEVAPYHWTDDHWYGERAAVRAALAAADGVVVISNDTHAQLRRARLPVDEGRIFVVENGTDHLLGSEEATMPGELVRRGLAGQDFVLVLGANYGHKNRELAIRTHTELRHRGRTLALVIVGASVPFGSRRDLEARAVLEHHREFGTADHIVTVPDVTSEERNWLLRHASVVLYPTSAEGFGLVPFEAASFGTPTVAVGFGPISEVAPDLPVVAAGWDPDDLATGVERLLDDRDLYDRQVAAVLRSGTGYTWKRTAAGLVDAYRVTLSLPSRTL